MGDSGIKIFSIKLADCLINFLAEEPSSKRSRREKSYKAQAFNKFKELKSGKRKKYEIEELESVYEIVEEKEYVKRVLDRQDDDWIVNDGETCYFLKYFVLIFSF